MKKLVIAALIPALLAGPGWPGERELKTLEGLASEPSTDAKVFHGQRSGTAASAVDGSESGRARDQADLGLTAKPQAPKKPLPPDALEREPKETPQEKETREASERSGKAWGGAVGGVLGLLTGGALAWGIAIGGGPIGLAIVAGTLMAGLGVYIGMDVGKACGPDPECP